MSVLEEMTPLPDTVWRSGAPYAVSSSLMLIANRALLLEFPCPTAASVAQFLSVVLALHLLRAAGAVPHERVASRQLAAFALIPALLTFTIISNQHVLLNTSVGTVLVLRCMVPLVTAALDALVLGHMLPTARSSAALGLVLLGTCLAARSSVFSGDARVWSLCYVGGLLCDLLIAKLVLEHVGIGMSMWSRVFWNNLLGAVIAVPMFAFSPKEVGILLEYATGHRKVTAHLCALMGLSCVIGAALTYTTFDFRRRVAPTTFALVGNANKILAVVVSQLLWPMDSVQGLLGMLLALGGASLYKQSPLRAPGVKLRLTSALVLPVLAIIGTASMMAAVEFARPI